MMIHGVEVTNEMISAAIGRMKQSPYFAAYQIENVLSKLNHPFPMRAADRIIQRERKAGNIIRVRQLWRHNEAPEAQ